MNLLHERGEIYEALPAHTWMARNESITANGRKPANWRRLKKERNIMKLKITFGKETRFGVPTRQIIRTWTQLLFGTRHSLHSLAMAERPKPGWSGSGS
jgi:hypothetical protein